MAPNGTILTISANPSKIGLNGRSTITVVGRKPDGNPLNPGTEIRLTSDKGTIESVVTTDSSGRAEAVFRGDGRSGAAKITAATAGTTVDTTIQVGESTETKPTVLLTVNPSVIPTEGTATVTVVGRNSDGSPAANQQVILTSSLGTLGSTRLTTNSSGTATTTLTATTQAGTAKVTAVLGSSDAATVDVEIRGAVLTLTANRTAVPEQATTQITLRANLTTFQGTPIQNKSVSFRSERGVLSATSDLTDEDGDAIVTLTVTASSVDANETFQVVAQAPSGAGAPLEATLNITIENTIK
ncbi:MAG: Ig-like domain-containing protein [Thermoanaerobaculia bacterium]